MNKLCTFIYHLMEDLDGEHGGKKKISYRIAEKIKWFCLIFIK